MSLKALGARCVRSERVCRRAESLVSSEGRGIWRLRRRESGGSETEMTASDKVNEKDEAKEKKEHGKGEACQG